MPLQDLTPQLRTRLNRMEKAVGWFVFIAAALLLFGFGYYIYHTAKSKGWFDERAYFRTYLQSSAGLKKGDPVLMMGSKVGFITDIFAMPPDDKRNVRVDFVIFDPHFRYIRSGGSKVKLNGGLLGQAQLEVTRGTVGTFAMAVSQPIYHKTIEELRPLVQSQPGQWQLSQYIRDAQSNAVFIPYQPYDGLAVSNLDLIASLNVESNSVYVFNNQNNAKEIVGVWRSEFQRYESYDHAKNDPIELPSDESVPVADRIDRIVAQVENAMPALIALTNQLTLVMNNAVGVTSNLDITLASANATLISAQPAITNLNTLLVNTDTNLGALLINLSEITGELSSQVRGNTNLVGGIYKTIMDTDDMVQGLKRHWLLRSAFKTNQPTTKKK